MDDIEKHCNKKVTLTISQIRCVWSDLDDNTRMEVLKSVIWTSDDMHNFYKKAMKILSSDEFLESLD